MINQITQTPVTPNTGTLTVAETEQAIQARARDIIQNASLALVQERLPHAVPVVQAMIAELDFNKPLTIAKAGAWALQDQAQMGVELLTALQQGPDQDTLRAVTDFEQDLHVRVKPLQKRLDERAGRGPVARFFAPAKQWLASAVRPLTDNVVVNTVRHVGAAIIPERFKRHVRPKKIHSEMDSLRQDDALLGQVVTATIADTVKVKGLLATSKHVPEVIAARVDQVLATHEDAAEKLYLTLVAVNEYQGRLTAETIPTLQQKAVGANALTGDVDTLQRAQESVGLLETRRTDLTAAILNTCLQRGMAAEMAHINAASATEMERLESIALPQMLGTLGTLALQQRTGELAVTTRVTNQIVAASTQSTAAGFRQVLAYSKAADAAKLQAAESVISATGQTLDALRDFRAHEAAQIGKQHEVQERLAIAIGALRGAAARSEATPNDGRFLVSPTPVVMAPPANQNGTAALLDVPEAPTRDTGRRAQGNQATATYVPGG